MSFVSPGGQLHNCLFKPIIKLVALRFGLYVFVILKVVAYDEIGAKSSPVFASNFLARSKYANLKRSISAIKNNLLFRPFIAFCDAEVFYKKLVFLKFVSDKFKRLFAERNCGRDDDGIAFFLFNRRFIDGIKARY